MWYCVVWCMCAASKLTGVAASRTHAHAQARTYQTTRRHIVEDNLFIYTIYAIYINYSRLPILVTGSLLHRTKLLFLYPLDEFLYMDFWNIIKELKNKSLHSLCSENLKTSRRFRKLLYFPCPYYESFAWRVCETPTICSYNKSQ
jgi:hypothetical protein